MGTEVYKYLFDMIDLVKIIEKHVLDIKSLSDYENDLKLLMQ